MEVAIFKAFGEALAIGLLVGIERYKDRDPGEKKPAGIRTFTIISLLGAACALAGERPLTLITFAALALFLALGYRRQPRENLGLTTELAALLTFWLGYLVRDYEALAVSAGIVLVIFLASKRALHDFVKGQVSDAEFFDTLKFLAVVFVVLPLLPDRGMGPYGFLNPSQVWKLVILVSAIGYSGYVLVRVLGAKRGLALSALVGGIVSTTAVTVSLAERSRKAPELSRTLGVTGVAANAVQFPRLLALLWVVSPALALDCLPLLAAMFVAGVAGAWLLRRSLGRGEAEPEIELLLQNPFSLWPALKFGLFFVGVILAARLAIVLVGEGAIYPTSALAGIGSASAITLSLADLVEGGSLPAATAAWALLLAILANVATKWALAIAQGTRAYALWLGGGLATMLAAGAAVLLAL